MQARRSEKAVVMHLQTKRGPFGPRFQTPQQCVDQLLTFTRGIRKCDSAGIRISAPTIGRVFTDKCIELFMNGELDSIDAAMGKMWLSNLHCKVVDECLQLFGGWGYMWEYPIARAYADARIVKIAGGSIEIMKYIIGRHMMEGRIKRKA